jgi:hypothetical protein
MSTATIFTLTERFLSPSSSFEIESVYACDI